MRGRLAGAGGVCRAALQLDGPLALLPWKGPGSALDSALCVRERRESVSRWAARKLRCRGGWHINRRSLSRPSRSSGTVSNLAGRQPSGAPRHAQTQAMRGARQHAPHANTSWTSRRLQSGCPSHLRTTFWPVRLADPVPPQREQSAAVPALNAIGVAQDQQAFRIVAQSLHVSVLLQSKAI